MGEFHVLQKSTELPARCRYFLKREKTVEKMLEELRSPERCVAAVSPSGSGKTQLFAQIARQRGDALWYDLKEQDQDPVRFLTLMTRAIRGIFGTRKEIKKQQDFYAGNGKLQEWLELLESQFLPGVEPFFIFDNVQVITSRAITDFLQQMEAYLPAGAKVVFLASQPLPFLARKEAEGMVKRYGWEQCFFSEAETGQIARFHGKEETAPMLYELFCGFPAGTCMALYGCGDQNGGLTRETAAVQSGVMKFLSYEVSERLTWKERAFLSEMAALGEWDIPLGNAVSQGGEAQKMWMFLLERSLFVRVKKGKMEYLPFFREFLEMQISAQEKQEALHRAAEYYFSTEQEELALAYAKRGKNSGQIADYLCRKGTRLLEQKKYSVAGACVRHLEQERQLVSAQACSMAAQYYYAIGEKTKVSYYLNRADSMFGQDNCYGSFRSIYRALEQCRELAQREEIPEEIRERLIQAVEFLKQEQQPLPYLLPEDRERLERMVSEKSGIKEETKKFLSIRYFGKFEAAVMPEGKMLSWRTKKGAELLAYLADAKEPVERKKLLEVLWEDHVPDHAVAMLHNCIYHLRKELSDAGLDGILVYEGKKYSLKQEYIYDSLEGLEESMRRLQSGKIPHREELSSYFSEYPGSFLEGFDSRWCRERRSRYDQMYERGAVLLSEEYRKRQERKKAIRVLEELHRINPFSEAAVEALIRDYAAEKDWKKVKRLYEEYEKVLKEELGVRPDRKISALLKEYWNYSEPGKFSQDR